MFARLVSIDRCNFAFQSSSVEKVLQTVLWSSPQKRSPDKARVETECRTAGLTRLEIQFDMT
jgi:hypothetical protein